MSLGEQIYNKFSDKSFTLEQVYNEFKNKPKTTIRGRIYDNLGIKFERISKGVYQTIKGDSKCIIIEGNGRDLSMLEDNSIDAIICDSPWKDAKSNKGGNRNFTSNYECFEYDKNDFMEKFRVLKEGSFLVEIIPAENENNYEYLYKIKQMAKECGLNYYSKVPWKKGTFVSNTGRKAKNTEDVMFFTKGKARNLKIDAKKTKAYGETQYMSGTNGMLPTEFNVQAVSKTEKVHQSEKPVKLYEQILNFISKPKELILDQYAGSGALGVAALNTNRDCILIELLKSNVDIITRRLNAVILPY